MQDQVDYYYNPNGRVKDIPNDLIGFIDYYVSQRTGEVKDTSLVKYRVIKNKMIRFQKFLGRTIFINEIDLSFRDDFINFYRKEKYAVNTMQRELNIIKTLICY